MHLGPEAVLPSESLPHLQCALFWGQLPSGHMQKMEEGREGRKGSQEKKEWGAVRSQEEMAAWVLGS